MDFSEGMNVTWRRLLAWAAWAGIVEYVIVMATSRQVIPPVIVIGIAIVVGALLLRREGKAGVVTLLVALVVFVLTNLVFASGDLSEPRSFPSFVVAASALVTGIVGVIAAIATLRGGTASGASRTITLATGAVVVGLLAVNAGLSITYDDPTQQASDVTVVARDIKFTPKTLTASAGAVTFYLDNEDAVLHNFHLKKQGTVSLPASHAKRFTFTLAAGTYEYVCDFHDDMKGTLTVT